MIAELNLTRDSDLHRSGAIALILLAHVALFIASASAQADSPLGDVARQARGDRAQAKSATFTPATQATKRLVNELEKDEEAGTPPDGFDTYVADGYKVWVPSPYSIEGRNESGTLLATADITGVTTKVFAATPIDTVSHPSLLGFEKLALDFWRPFGWIKCDPGKPGISEHRCTLGGQLLGNRVDGTARFLEGDSRIVPVVCFATAIPDVPVDFSKVRSREERAAMADRAVGNMGHRSMAQRSNDLCGAVLDSVRLKERPASFGMAEWSAPAGSKSVAQTKERAGGDSLGELARESRKAQSASAKVRVEATDTVDRAPAGFRTHSKTRCAAQCREERFVLPDSARKVKGGNTDNVYVSMLDADTSIIIYFGRTEVVNGYSEFGIAQDLAHRWIHGQRDYAFKTVDLSRSIDAQIVPISRSRLTANMNAWMEEEAFVGGENEHFKIGCIAREDRFADTEPVCATVFESWRVHTE